MPYSPPRLRPWIIRATPSSDGRRDADGRVGRRDRDHQRSEAHQQHRQHQRVAPAVVIGEMAEQPAADRPDDEADREQDRGVQLLDDRIVAGKERRGEIQRERRVGVEVVPLDEIADRPTKIAFRRRRTSVNLS